MKMNNNLKKLFLLSMLLFIFMGLTAVSSVDSANTTTDSSTDISDYQVSTDDSYISSDRSNSNNNIGQYEEKTKINSSSKNENIKKDSNTINLNNENLEDYFEREENELFSKDTISNSIIILEEDLTDVKYWFFDENVNNITFTTNDDIELTNQAFTIECENFTFANTSFIYYDGFGAEKSITVTKDGFKIDNCNFNYDCSIIGEQTLNTILYLQADYATITGSQFVCNIPSTQVDWDDASSTDYYGLPQTVPLVIRGNYININDNEFTITEKYCQESTAYPTFYGMYITGHNINFTGNTVSLTGSNGYVYAVYLKSENSNYNYNITVAENDITAISEHNYTAGIYIDGQNYQNITVLNNNITVTSGFDVKEDLNELQDVAYGVVITNYGYQGGNYILGVGNVTNNYIINNTIIAQAHQSYGFEQYGGENTVVTGNDISVIGSRAQAVGVIGINTTITDNTLAVVGETALGEGSPDYVPPITAGVQTLHAYGSTISNNTIEVTSARGILLRDSENNVYDNNVTVHDYEYTIEIMNTTDNLIENNTLTTDTSSGSQTIYDDTGDNTIGNNTDEASPITTTLYPDELYGVLGETSQLIVVIEGEDDYTFDGEYIKIYANDDEILSGIINDGIMDANLTIPTSWYKQNIILTAKYPGNSQYQESEEEIDYIILIPTSIVSEDTINVAVNDKITTVTLIDIMNNTIDSAINIYEDDNYIAELSNYTFDSSTLGSHTYKLEFEEDTLSDGYNYASSQKEVTVNVNKRQANISMESIETIVDTPTTITVQLSDLSDNTRDITDGIIEFTDEENNILAAANVEDSSAITQITFDTIGEKIITVTFKNSTIYEDTAVNTTIIVNKKITPVYIVLELDDEYELGDTVEVTAMISDDDENEVSNVNIELYINNEYITSLVSDETGWITYEYTPSNAGNYTFTLTVNDDDYTADNTTVTVLVTQPKQYSLQVTTTEFTVGTNTTLQAVIYADNETATDITKGKVVFKVNGKTLKDSNNKIIYAKIVNGTATIENYYIPVSWDKENITIEAVYSGSSQLSSLRSNKTLITINKQEAYITTEDINTTRAGTITLKATITDNNQVISAGKIVFKINGKTLKDANGKVIYAQVTNNTASMEYTLPNSYKSKTYNITAIFISTGYERLEDTKTLTVN